MFSEGIVWEIGKENMGGIRVCMGGLKTQII